MKLESNIIIKCNLDSGFKFIKGIYTYDLLLIDDIDLLIKYENEIKELLNHNCSLIIHTKKQFTLNNINKLNMKLIFKKNIHDKYLYFYGNETINNNYYKDKIKQMNNSLEKFCFIDENTSEEEYNKINLFNKDNILNYNINRLLNKCYDLTSKINVLDLTKEEDLSQILITNNSCNMTMLGCNKLKVKTTCSIYGKKLSFIEIL